MITENEIGCDNCYYSHFDEKAYPCSLCIRGIERTDQWQPNRKTKEGSHDEAIKAMATLIKAKIEQQTETEAD